MSTRRGRLFAITAVGMMLAVTIPPNTTATVYVPTEDVESVRESPKPAAKAEGVTFLGMDAGKAVLAVGSGRYRFASKLSN